MNPRKFKGFGQQALKMRTQFQAISPISPYFSWCPLLLPRFKLLFGDFYFRKMTKVKRWKRKERGICQDDKKDGRESK